MSSLHALYFDELAKDSKEPAPSLVNRLTCP